MLFSMKSSVENNTQKENSTKIILMKISRLAVLTISRITKKTNPIFQIPDDSGPFGRKNKLETLLVDHVMWENHEVTLMSS